jgi:hypothetical protein
MMYCGGVQVNTKETLKIGCGMVQEIRMPDGYCCLDSTGLGCWWWQVPREVDDRRARKTKFQRRRDDDCKVRERRRKERESE